MASTYVNDLRLNEMATGDASGTWGTTTNTNLELIGEALGYGTEAITTNADTHTSTIADGATDPVRAMFVKYTGSLDSACTITIAPNTVNRMHFIENGTSGSQNIIISQGSGANITIPPGDTKAVYLDGAGSGAAVVDAFASLSVVDLKVQDDLTVTDDATIGGTLGVTGIVTLTDDLIIGDGKTIGSASDVDAITIAANGQLTLTQTLIGTALDISGDIDVDGTSNLDIVDIDGAVDMASTLNVSGAITSSAGATITTADNSENLILKSTDADASVGPQLTLWRASGSPADDDFIGQISYNANDDGGNVTNFAKIFGRIRDASDGTEDAQLTLSSMVAGTLRNRLEFNEGEVVFNDDSVDVDFRVESDNLTHALFLQGSDGRVGIGTDSPDAILEVVDAGAAAPGTALKVYSNQNSAATDGLVFIHSDQDVAPFTALNVRQDGNGDILNLLDGTTEVFTVLNGGNVGIGNTNPSRTFMVNGQIEAADSSGSSRVLLRYQANAEGFSTANSAMLVGKNDTAGRSINCGGTVNASGADYAEYMKKADSCGTIAKGDVVGVDSDGKLTKTFSDAKSFVIKSTNPSYVGGDTWGNADLELTEKQTEIERQKYDRIAFSGQVPVNITGSFNVGDYVYPQVNSSGIKAVAKSSTTFEEYQLCVGKIWATMEDGRPLVAVKIG